MKIAIKLSFILLFILASCKTTKNVTDTTAIKKMAPRKIVKKHLDNVFDVHTVDSKIKVRYTNNRGERRKRHEFTVRLRMQKDSIIWIKANKVVTVFKAKITPATFSYYSPLDKTYFEGDYTVLEKLLGIEVTFDQLQNMLIGQNMFEMKGKKHDAVIDGTSYKITPRIQEQLFDVFYKINPNHFKLDQLFLNNEAKDQSLRINYKGYKNFNETLIPIGIEINATEGMKYTYFNLNYRNIQVNKSINIPYRVPKSYKRLVLHDVF